MICQTEETHEDAYREETTSLQVECIINVSILQLTVKPLQYI